MNNNKYNSNSRMTRNQSYMINKMIQDYYFKANLRDLRSDVANWFETSIKQEISSSIILAVVQRPGWEQQIIPLECKNRQSACIDCSSVLAKVINETGAKVVYSDIYDGRLVITTDNQFKITMVLD